MSKAEILEELRRMPEAERREVVELIEIEFGDFDDELTDEQKAELDRRAEKALAHPERCRPLDDVVADMEKRFRAKQ
jgi:hypothetical protein